MPTVQPAPEPVSPEPIAVATRPSRSVARSPEPQPMFISIPPAPVAAPPPAMVPMPTMVPAPVAVPMPVLPPSAVSNDSISLPPTEPAAAGPEKPKTSFAAVVKPG